VETRKSLVEDARRRDFAYDEEERLVSRSLVTAGRRMLVASPEVRHQITMPSASADPLFISEASICFVVALVRSSAGAPSDGARDVILGAHPESTVGRWLHPKKCLSCDY
jgi:hypothetical protein